MVTTEARKTGLGITLRLTQNDADIFPIFFCSNFSSDTEKTSTGKLESLRVVWVMVNFRLHLYIFKESTFLHGSRGTSTADKTEPHQSPI